MKNKILCLILISAVVCSVFVISASADETTSLSVDYNAPTDLTGTIWRLNDDVSALSTEQRFNLYFTATCNEGYSFTSSSNSRYIESDPTGPIFSCGRSSGGSLLYFPTFEYNSAVSGWVYVASGSSSGVNVSGVTFSFTGGNDANNPTFISWLMDNGIWLNAPIPEPIPGVLSAGSYQISGDFLDISAFSWINSGDTVYFDANGYIIQDFNTGTRFSQIGITYTEVDANAYVLQLSALVYTSVGQAFQPFVTFTYSPNGNVIYWHTDNFPDAYGIYFDYDVVVPTDILNIFLVFFDEFEQVYTGNVWYDIIDNVVEALQVDVFGYFSPWDILTTFIGLAIFLWLLKALAGG